MLCLFQKEHNITHDAKNVYIDKKKIFTKNAQGRTFYWNYKRRVWVVLPNGYTPSDFAKTLKRQKANYIIEILVSTYSDEYKQTNI